MNAPLHTKALKIATEIGKPGNVDLIEAQLVRKGILSKLSVADRIELETSFADNRAAIDAANDEHANRVLAQVKRDAAKLMADLPHRIDEEPNHGPLWDDHDIASIRAASWDESL